MTMEEETMPKIEDDIPHQTPMERIAAASEKIAACFEGMTDSLERIAAAHESNALEFGELAPALKNLELLPVRIGEMIEMGIGKKTV